MSRPQAVDSLRKFRLRVGINGQYALSSAGVDTVKAAAHLSSRASRVYSGAVAQLHTEVCQGG